MDSSLAAPIATLVGAIATAILMFASYNWPAGQHRRWDDEEDEYDDPPKKKKKKVIKEEETDDEDE